MFEVTPSFPSVAVVGGEHPTCAVDAAKTLAHALVLVPNMPRSDVSWYPTAKFLLMWQVRWLQHCGLSVTLVLDRESAVVAQEIALEKRGPLVDVISWNDFAGLESPSGLTDGRAAALLLMPGPALCACDLRRIVKGHQDGDRNVTVVRHRGGRQPFAFLYSSRETEMRWSSMRTALQAFDRESRMPTARERSAIAVSVRAELLRTGDAREMRRLAALWPECAPQAGLVQVTGQPGVFQTEPGSARIASTARVRGPAWIGAGATIGEGAHLGPWTALDSACFVGRDAWLEQATIGAGAQVAADGCVYASIVAARASVRAPMPLLKAYLPAAPAVAALAGKSSAGAMAGVPSLAMMAAEFADPNEQAVLDGPEGLASVVEGDADGAATNAKPILLPGAQVNRTLSPMYRVAKRVMDLVLGGIALLCLAPLLLGATVLCLLSQGWPIFFRHERVGLQGQLFYVFKLQTMRHGAHSPVVQEALRQLEASDRFKIANDPRVTPVGRLLRKTSLDELPQLCNVLGGSMSVVGPRPIVFKEMQRYGMYARDLVQVTPGMTGLWQVSGRSNTTYARRIMLDVWYADHASLRLDIEILLRSIPAVLFFRGVQ